MMALVTLDSLNRLMRYFIVYDYCLQIVLIQTFSNFSFSDLPISTKYQAQCG